MTTLNIEAENIAYKMGDQFNMTLRESIKLTLINYRAKFIRDDVERNGLSLVHFLQTTVVDFEEVDLLTALDTFPECISVICDNVSLQNKYKVLKSKKPIPLPLRFKTRRSPYLFIGRGDGSKAFQYVELDQYPYIKHLKYSERTIYYTIINNYLYIINNLNECDINRSLKICKVLIKDVFENPRDLYNACSNTDTFIDDMPFPIGLDMLLQISNGIIKGEYPLIPKDGEQINIKPDGNN